MRKLVQSLLEDTKTKIINVFRIWLGLSDIDTESVFRTTEGFTTQWANWKPGEPIGFYDNLTENCVERLQTGMWNDLPCSLARKFYCETKRKCSHQPKKQ